LAKLKQNKTNDEILSLLTKVTDLEQQFHKNGKNTVILFADLEGSTHYKTTHTFFESLRKIMTHNSVINDAIKENHGNVIKWLGDGIMASFSEKDIVKSIKASLQIMKFFLEYNKDKSKEDRINTKIGISIGHCLEISDAGNIGTDLMGLAVDTASRIQTLAKPRQILIDHELLLKIKDLAHDKKKHDVSLGVSFSSPKLRNLRGIGPVRIVEVKWNKFLGIKREGDDFTSEQLTELASVLSRSNTENLIHGKSNFCKPLLSDEDKQTAVRNGFENSRKTIRILAYSLSSWKERIEKPLLDAVRRGIKVEILVLSSMSKYRFEKTLYESFHADLNLKDWIKDVRKIKQSYQTNLQNTLDTVKIWQSQLDKSQHSLLLIRSYDEMPNYYGFMFDEDKLYFSSFYVDLAERGYNLPAVFLQKNKDMLGDIIIQGFQNWFDIKFALNESVYGE
jgi:class 3 adenylate cyclase